MKLVNLFVEEMSGDEVVFATWCVGVRTRKFFYVMRVSVSNLMARNEMLKISVRECMKEPEMSNLYTITIDANSNPREDDRFQYVDENVFLTEDVFCGVLEAYNRHHAGTLQPA